MQLTVELDDAGQVSTVAHLAEIISLSRENDPAKMRALCPRDTIEAVRDLMEAFDNVLTHMDTPHSVSKEDGELANSLAHRMQGIGESILQMK